MVKVSVKCKEPEGYLLEMSAVRTTTRDNMFSMINEGQTISIPLGNILEVTEVRE